MGAAVIVAVLGGWGCCGTGTVLDLEGDLKRRKGFEDGLVVAGVGSGDGGTERRRFGKKNPSGSGRRLDWREASLSDLSGDVPERRNAGSQRK